jgi:large subunit ribosomal protein L21
MYAIVETGGKQYRVQEQAVLDVETLPAAAGERVEIARVLMVADGANVRVGTQVLADARIVCRVLAHGRGPRVRVFKYKPKSNYRRLQGHRQRVTRLLVERIETGAGATER